MKAKQDNGNKLITVRVAIPHFFQEKSGGTGYGSGKPGARFARSLALGRCLAGLLALERNNNDLVINIGKRWLDKSGPLNWNEQQLASISLDIHLFVNGDNLLHEVVKQFEHRLTVHRLLLEDPRQLPLAARDFLIQATPQTDLALYLEDDLVVGDPLFLDKQIWFLQGCQHQAVLMPHRYEPIPDSKGQRLLVDGPLRDQFIGRFAKPATAVGNGLFWDGQKIVFDKTANPHSGMFCLSKPQVLVLKNKELPVDGFIGPLETAATLTALSFFPVMKPALSQRHFLWIEHGHPSFQSVAKQWPLSTVDKETQHGVPQDEAGPGTPPE